MATAKKDDAMATDDDGGDEMGPGMGSGTSSGTGSDVGRESATFTNPMTDDSPPDTNPVAHIGGQEVEVVANADDTDTFHRMVVQSGPENPSDPGNQLVQITKDQTREFTYPGTTRTSGQLIAAAGTLTTRRQAEAMGLDKEAYQEVGG